MENNDLLFQIRINLGLTTSNAAQLVHVTRRTWELWESGKGKVPVAKLELIKEKIERLFSPCPYDGAELVVVTMDAGGYDMPVAVISNRNFCSLEQNADGTYNIKYLSIDRSRKQPYVCCQRFSRERNEHLILAAKKWKSVME